MKLYFVKRNDMDYCRGEHESFIVACENENEARKTHPDDSEKWQNYNWIEQDQIHTLEVTCLGQASPNLKKGVVEKSLFFG